MNDLAPLGLVVAGAAVVVWYLARRRAGREPLGPPPSGDLPDTTLALAAGALLWATLQFFVAPVVLSAWTRPGPAARTAVYAGLNAVVARALFRSATAGTRRPTLSRGRTVVAGFAAGVVVFAGVFVLGAAMTEILARFGVETPAQDVVKEAQAARGAARLVYVLCAVVLAPFAEEVFFRGVLFPAFARALGAPTGLLVQAALFGLVHVVSAWSTWPAAIPLAVVGWCAGRLYWRTGSLAAPIVLHATFNALNLAAMSWSSAA